MDDILKMIDDLQKYATNAIKEAYDNGHNVGYDAGRNDGYDIGYADGVIDGAINSEHFPVD